MATHDLDLFVIGGGSGGVRAARMAAQAGARVAIVESYRYGGTCVIRGCVPKKLLVYASHFHEDFEDAAGFGWRVGEAGFDWARLIANKDREIDRLEGVYERLLKESGVEVLRGHGRLLDAHRVRVETADGEGETTRSAETVLIATGGRPVFPPGAGWEHGISSNEAFHLERLPERIAVYGGGYIAVEFAGIFNGLGAEVTQIYRGPQILRGFDDDVRAALAQEIRKKGIDLRVECDIASIDRAGHHLELTMRDDSVMETDMVLYATGRSANTAGLGLEAAGVELDANGAVVVDEFSRTAAPSIYAIGDVTDRINLTPVAIKEAMAFVDTVYGGKPTSPDHDCVPSAVFSQPSVASVGLTEAEARAKFAEVDIYKSTFRALKHTLGGGDEQTMMKLVVDGASDRVVGCHMVGPDAAEIIQGMAIAVKCGATKAQFDATVGIHPSAAEEFVTMREKFVEPTAAAAE
jgi:glutathione reductase (NADPH)